MYVLLITTRNVQIRLDAFPDKHTKNKLKRRGGDIPSWWEAISVIIAKKLYTTLPGRNVPHFVEVYFQWHILQDNFIGNGQSCKCPRKYGAMMAPWHVNTFRIVLYHIISYHIISYHIIVYHILSSRLASPPRLTSPRLTSPHITSRHITSPHITSLHFTWHHITSQHHITSHRFTSQHHIASHHFMRGMHSHRWITSQLASNVEHWWFVLLNKMLNRWPGTDGDLKRHEDHVTLSWWNMSEWITRICYKQ